MDKVLEKVLRKLVERAAESDDETLAALAQIAQESFDEMDTTEKASK